MPPGKENGGQREPAVQEFSWVGEGVPWKIGFYKLINWRQIFSAGQMARKHYLGVLLSMLAQHRRVKIRKTRTWPGT